MNNNIITNGQGETLHFLHSEMIDGELRQYARNFVDPGIGPIMHTHHMQDEVFTVEEGTLGYEIAGQPLQYARPGETVAFKKGVPHRFWNAGKTQLICYGYVQPAHNMRFFLTTLFAAQRANGSLRPETFDLAFLSTRYKSEFRTDGIPGFVRNVIMPAAYLIGKLRGKYRKFKDAPAPYKNAA